jgi:hypothetical protein
MVEEQGWFDSPERWAKVLELLPEDARDNLTERVRLPPAVTACCLSGPLPPLRIGA